MPETTPLSPDFAAQFAMTLAAPDCTPEHLLARIAARLGAVCDLKLITMSHRDPSDGSFLRLYSSLPDAYAPQGRKPANETNWTRHVIDERRTFIANDYESLAAAMYDHQQIRDLGCESIINIPIVVQGEVVGTLNCLSGAGHFGDAMVAACATMRLPVATALMLHDRPARNA